MARCSNCGVEYPGGFLGFSWTCPSCKLVEATEKLGKEAADRARDAEEYQEERETRLSDEELLARRLARYEAEDRGKRIVQLREEIRGKLIAKFRQDGVT